MMKSQKGITLIALVITIIVMLILVTVTITMAINGNLFNYAKDAVTKTKANQTEENSLGSGNVKVDGLNGGNATDINSIVNHYSN